jgi:hypothetical protein
MNHSMIVLALGRDEDVAGHVEHILLRCVAFLLPVADNELRMVLDLLENMSHHLTAAVVSNDVTFLNNILAHTVNGTTYAGIRARTTGEAGSCFGLLVSAAAAAAAAAAARVTSFDKLLMHIKEQFATCKQGCRYHTDSLPADAWTTILLEAPDALRCTQRIITHMQDAGNCYTWQSA